MPQQKLPWADFCAQIESTVLNLAGAALPDLRVQRSGLVGHRLVDGRPGRWRVPFRLRRVEGRSRGLG